MTLRTHLDRLIVARFRLERVAREQDPHGDKYAATEREIAELRAEFDAALLSATGVRFQDIEGAMP